MLKKDASKIVWKRTREIHPEAKLVIGGLSANDVVQGDLGDCWLLSAFSLVAANKSLFKKLFKQVDEDAGKYTVRFYLDKKWTEVTVDDFLPCLEEGGRYVPLFARASDCNETWVSILEKAYAKVTTNFFEQFHDFVHSFIHSSFPIFVVIDDRHTDATLTWWEGRRCLVW